jgi:hypothetical protein
MLAIQQFDDLFSPVTIAAKYPTPTELEAQEVPFSQQLGELAFDDKKYKEHNDHIKDVVVKANRMLAARPSSLVGDISTDPLLREMLDNLFLQLQVWANHYQLESQSIIRAAAVYHDIGKWIVKERHPTEGYYLLQYLFPDQGTRLRYMVGPEAFQLLMAVIRDHDKFGITSTGEASSLVLIDLLNPAKSEVQFYKMAVIILMLTNFADIAVSAPTGLLALQARWIVEDAQRMLAALEEGSGDRLKVSWHLLQSDSSAAQVTTRVARLVDAAYKNAQLAQRRADQKCGVVFNPQNWQEVSFDIIANACDRKLQVHFLGSAYQRFCTEFAHYCKFDYALYFFGEVARQLNLKRLNEGKDEFPIDDLVGVIVHVLKSIVETYRELVEKDGAAPRRIGIQMQGLLRPGVKDTVAGFLAGTKGPATRDVANVVSWITNEVSAWLFI